MTAVGGNAVQCRIQRNIQLWRRRVDDVGPVCLDGEVIGAVREGRIIIKCRTDFFIVRIKSLFDQLLTQHLDAVIKLFTDKAQKDEREHHIALFKEGTGVPGFPQNVAALEED